MNKVKFKNYFKSEEDYSIVIPANDIKCITSLDVKKVDNLPFNVLSQRNSYWLNDDYYFSYNGQVKFNDSNGFLSIRPVITLKENADCSNCTIGECAALFGSESFIYIGDNQFITDYTDSTTRSSGIREALEEWYSSIYKDDYTVVSNDDVYSMSTKNTLIYHLKSFQKNNKNIIVINNYTGQVVEINK